MSRDLHIRKICPKCQAEGRDTVFTEVPEDAVFFEDAYWFQCPHCGTTLYVPVQPEQMKEAV